MKNASLAPAVSHTHSITPTRELFDTGATTLKLLAEPTRLRILWKLTHGEQTVTELVNATHAPRTVVSQHLAKLRAASLVAFRKSGRNVIYRIGDGHLTRLVAESLDHADYTMFGDPHHRR